MTKVMKVGTIILAASSMIVHSWGAFFFYGGVFGIIFGYGTAQIMPSILMYGATIMISGIILGIYAGKRLKSTHLAAISIAYPIVATSCIYLIFSGTMPNQVFPFLPHILLGTMTLDIAFPIGYFKNKRTQNAPH